MRATSILSSVKNFTKLKRFHHFYKFERDLKAKSIRGLKKYEVVLLWLQSYLTRSQFLILSGILVGCTAGFAGVFLKELVHYIHYLITTQYVFEQQLIFYFVFPLMGILLTALVVKYFFKGNDRKGVPAILYEIAQNSSMVAPVKMYSQIITSAITVGLGGSAGLEGPIAVTGSAIGSNFAQTYKLDYKDRTLLLAAGATAGIAAAFNAPVAGVMFAFEILLTGVVFTDFIPLVVAAVCGSLISRIVLNEEILFQFNTRNAFNYKNIPFHLALAILCGLYARYYVVMAQWVEHQFKNLKISKIKKAAVAGLMLSMLCILFPPLFGEGYSTIKGLVNGQVTSIVAVSFLKYFPYHTWFILLFLGFICLLKVFATSITIFGGGNGGNFAPSLFAGGALGFFLATVFEHLGIHDVPVANMVLVGMAGVMSGVMYAPLTAIFLIAESSSGYDLFIPLMISSVISFLIAKKFSPIPPDLKTMADEGKVFTREHDRNLLSLLNMTDLIDKNVQTIDAHALFQELIDLIKVGRRNFIAVVNSQNNLEGIVMLDDIRPIMFNKEHYDTLSIQEVMTPPPALISIKDQMNTIAKKFDETNTWNLPVVDGDQFVGFISRSSILNSYRELLKEHSA